MTKMMRNPKQMSQMLGSKMDPRMLQQFGGADNMMEMMKQVLLFMSYVNSLVTWKRAAV